MRYDEYGNPIEEQDPNAAWNDASNQINAWKDKNASGRDIDWGAAQSAWSQSGGDLNKVFGQSNAWLSGGPQAAQAAPVRNAKSDYEGFRNDWLGQGFGSQTSADKLAATAAKYGFTVRGGDKVYDAQGNFVGDMIGDVGTGNTLQFLRGAEGHATTDKLYGGKSTPKGKTPKGAPKSPKGGINPPGPPNLPPGPPAPPTPPGGGGGGGGNPSPATPEQDARWKELYDQLLQRSHQGLAVDRTDPNVRAQADAFSAQQTREQRNYLSDLAERSGPTANLRGEQRMAAERAGVASGNMEAELIGREIGARRTEIQNALTQMGDLLTDEQRRALQQQLALMDDATKRYGLNLQNSQYYAGLKQQKQLAADEMKYKYASLSQQQKQFMEEMGYRWSGFEWQKDPANPQNRL